MRKAAEIQKVVELQPAGLEPLVASGHDPRAGRPAPTLPPAGLCQSSIRAPGRRRAGPPSPRRLSPAAAPDSTRSAGPRSNQRSSNPASPANEEHLAAPSTTSPRSRRNSPAGPESNRHRASPSTAEQRALERPAPAAGSAPRPARAARPGTRRRRASSRPTRRGTAAPAASGRAQSTSQASTSAPSKRPARMSSSRIAARSRRPDRLGVVHAQPGRRLQRARVHPAARPGTPPRRKLRSRSWSVKPSSVPSRRLTGQQRQTVVAPPSRCACKSDRCAHQTRTSTTGTDGTSPAANLATEARVDPVGIEPHRHVELEARRDRGARRRRLRQADHPVGRDRPRSRRLAAAARPAAAT